MTQLVLAYRRVDHRLLTLTDLLVSLSQREAMNLALCGVKASLGACIWWREG